MARSSRFIVAVHVLALLADKDQPLTSDYVAGSVNTNPVSIRRILGLLIRAKLVGSTEGAGGGTMLARRASSITLADVHRAVEGEVEMFASPRNDPNPSCPIGRCVQNVLKERTKKIEATLARELEKTTIADVLADARAARRR